jgi:hypothetical protein
MRVVRNIVDTGRTITCTVHQPSIEIFEVRCPGALEVSGTLFRAPCLSVTYLEIFNCCSAGV